MIGVLDNPAKAKRCQAFEARQRGCHEAVRRALASGALQAQACEVGDGCNGPVCAHHDDYTQPLVVRWLCRRHHDARHRELGWGYSRETGDQGDALDGWQTAKCRWPEPPGTPTLADCGFDDLADLDFAMFDAPEPVANPWLERRRHGFGGSEIAMLLVALDRVSPADVAALPKYAREGAPGLFKRKAFPGRERKAGSAASRGSAAERPCLEEWARSADARHVADVTHESRAPRCWFPLVDRHCPRLTVTPDGWATSVLDEAVGIEVKTTIEPIGSKVPWWWRVQVQAQNAVGGYAWSVIVVGEGWAHWQPERRLPPRSFRVDPDPHEIERIRAACRDGWARVEEMRAEKSKGRKAA